MTRKALRRWSWVHKWSSLVSTIFLLMLCVTGLPLVFRAEIDRFLGAEGDATATQATAARPSIEAIVAAGNAKRPGEHVQFVVWDRDDSNVVLLSMAASRKASPENNTSVRVDTRTASVIEGDEAASRVTGILLKLHTEMFAGLPGKLVLGLMALLFVAALVSGAVLYGPFMRKIDFGTVRRNRSTRIRWLDLHNLLGISVLSWMLVVGGTGVMNAWADLLIQLWQYDQLSEMTGPYKNRPLPDRMVPLDDVVARAREAVPNTVPYIVAMPGSLLTSDSHFAVFMRGETPLTARLLTPTLIDAVTGELTATREMAWYISVLLLSQPLHFGDYGGMPLKILWALLDAIAIVVLGSGIYLWIARYRSSADDFEIDDD